MKNWRTVCLLCISWENRTKLKKILNLNPRLKWDKSSQIYNLHLIFLSTLLNLNGEQTKINMGMDIMLIRGIVLKVINNEKTIITHQKSLISLHNKLCWLSLKCVNNQSCGFNWTYEGQVSHLLIHLSSLTFVL